MATVFWDSKGIILIDYKPAGTLITGKYYANVIKQLRVAIKEKQRGKLAAGVLLHEIWSPTCAEQDFGTMMSSRLLQRLGLRTR